MIKAISLLSVVFLVSSCGPFYNTEYEFVPPQRTDERTCANSCIKDKTNCFQRCKDRSTIEGFGQNLFTALGSPNFHTYEYHKRECEESCNQDHRMCHENCGGKVIAKKVCVYGCKSKKR